MKFDWDSNLIARATSGTPAPAPTVAADACPLPGSHAVQRVKRIVAASAADEVQVNGRCMVSLPTGSDAPASPRGPWHQKERTAFLPTPANASGFSHPEIESST